MFECINVHHLVLNKKKRNPDFFFTFGTVVYLGYLLYIHFCFGTHNNFMYFFTCLNALTDVKQQYYQMISYCAKKVVKERFYVSNTERVQVNIQD